MRINKHDTQGTKPLLAKGELGYDDYTAGGDTGRVYVGTGVENIALAERLEANTMTKAQFNALAEERKANRAGSGWDEWGKHYSPISIRPNVNEGISVDPLFVNSFALGWGNPNASIGVSKTRHPVCSIAGTLLKILGVNTDGVNLANAIQLPTAPTIYPHDTVLTPEQIASGVIKHADASNSGLIVNGKFDTDTSGWVKAPNYDSTAVINNGKLRVTATGAFGRYLQPIPTVVGKTYIVNGEATLISGGGSAIVNLTNSGGADLSINVKTFVATTSTSYISCALTSAGAIGEFDNIAVYPADAISRSDLVFPESYHEDIAEKGVGYPFGNVQYLGGNTDGLTGIANGAFTGFEQYSLFGNWQTPSALIGKGYVWSSLTESQKKAFISNPENNCYLDGDKTIQVRYRVRVQLGEDSNSMARATVQGKAVVPSTVLFTAPVTTVDAGLYSNTSATYTYTGTSTNAISIATISRRNQGMYHNVYNPNGTKLASDGLDCFRTTISFTNTMDCFDPAKLLTASGYIGTVSGRPDGLFYDQVHEGDVQDLRNSSNKVEDYNRLISREFNKLVAGTTRGKEGEIESIKVASSSTTGLELITNNYIDFGSSVLGSVFVNKIQYPNLGNGAYIRFETSGKTYILKPTLSDMRASASGRYLYYVPIDSTGFTTETGTWSLYFPTWTARTKSNTLLHCDIIGNPTNYPTAWKESGVFGTPLIVAEDGASLLPNGTLDTFKLSRKANATPLLCLRSTDNGATWTSFTPTFSIVTNAITLTDEPATNLVQVFYQTHTNMAVPTVKREVVEYGDVLSLNTGSSGLGSHLVSTLIQKVSTVSAGGAVISFSKFKNISFDNNRIQDNHLYYNPPIHEPANLFASSTPALKVFPYLTRLNGKAYLNLVFKEMKYNGTSWGDSNTFDIVDNVSTRLDNNAQTVLVGQKTVELPYFIDVGE